MTNEKMITQIKPNKVKSIFCPTKGCGELMVKIYPWASLTITGGITPCNKCLNKRLALSRKLATIK